MNWMLSSSNIKNKCRPHGRMKGVFNMKNMKKEYVKELKLLTQMITSRASNDEVRDQAKKVVQLGEQIISELEDE